MKAKKFAKYALVGIGGFFLLRMLAADKTAPRIAGLGAVDEMASMMIEEANKATKNLNFEHFAKQAYIQAKNAYDAQMLYETQGGFVNWLYAPGWEAVWTKIKHALAMVN